MRGAARSQARNISSAALERASGSTDRARIDWRPSLMQRNTRAPSGSSRCSSAALQRRPSSSVNTRSPPENRCGGLRVVALCTAPPVLCGWLRHAARRVGCQADAGWGMRGEGFGAPEADAHLPSRTPRSANEDGPANRRTRPVMTLSLTIQCSSLNLRRSRRPIRLLRAAGRERTPMVRTPGP